MSAGPPVLGIEPPPLTRHTAHRMPGGVGWGGIGGGEWDWVERGGAVCEIGSGTESRVCGSMGADADLELGVVLPKTLAHVVPLLQSNLR